MIASTRALSLIEDYSLEMTGKEVAKLADAHATIPPGTRINVTFLGNEDLQLRLGAARAVARLGFVPVPHISARRLASQEQAEEFLGALAQSGVSGNVFTVAGDPSTPEGPYEDALAVIRSGLLERHGVRHVCISGYPEGHPAIDEPTLWAALESKVAALREQGTPGTIITQFGFDSDAVLTWVEAVRARGIDLPIRIGVPGPAGVRRLLTYAARFGVGTSVGIAKKYGLSITNLMGTAGPDRFIRSLGESYDGARHGELKLHFYPFGGLKATSEWATEFRRSGRA